MKQIEIKCKTIKKHMQSKFEMDGKLVPNRKKYNRIEHNFPYYFVFI